MLLLIDFNFLYRLNVFIDTVIDVYVIHYFI